MNNIHTHPVTRRKRSLDVATWAFVLFVGGLLLAAGLSFVIGMIALANAIFNVLTVGI